MILHDLNETTTGSIKHITKKDPLVSSHIKGLEREVSINIVNCLSKSIQKPFFDYVVDAEDDTFIGRMVIEIDNIDAMLFCMREANADSNPFFQQHYVKLRNQLLNSEIPSVAWLISEIEKKDGVFEFITHIMNLDCVERWNGSLNFIPDNDATHSFRVTALSLFNGLLETNRFGSTEIDIYRLLGKSLFHDLIEGITGDVVSPIKKTSREIKQAFELYEKEVAKSMISKLPLIFHEEILDFMVNAKDNTYEGELVDISDKIDALIKSNLEMRNNPLYSERYFDQLTTIQHNYEYPCVIFFLAYILHDLTYSSR